MNEPASESGSNEPVSENDADESVSGSNTVVLASESKADGPAHEKQRKWASKQDRGR